MSDFKKGINGVWTAIVTPFRHDGSLDILSYGKILEKQADANVAGVVVSGTTGASPTLDSNEKLALIQEARKILPKHIGIMAGSGGNNTKTSIELSKRCLDAGADSLLIVTPPYNKPNQAGMYAHYESIAEATGAPICLYHVHHRTGQKLTPEQLKLLTEIPHVSAIKEASGELGLFSEAVRQSGVNVLSGDDPTYLASLAVGGQGVISVVTNIFPHAFVAMTNYFLNGDNKNALDIHQRLAPFIGALGIETNPCPIKSALCTADLIGPNLRLPLAPVTQTNEKVISALYQQTLASMSELGHL